MFSRERWFLADRNAVLKKTAFLLLAVAALIRSGTPSPAEDGPSRPAATGLLVERIIRAYGGRAVLENIHSLSARGVLDSPMYERPADYSFDLQEGRRLRVEIRAGRSSELRILNGTRGYYESTGSPQAAVSGPRLLAMAYQFKELTMPLRLLHGSFAVADGGRSEVHGVRVRLLLLTDSEGPPMKLYVDPENGHILKDSGLFAMGNAETELSSEFHDLRKVNGRLLPFRIVNYAGGRRIGEIRIREYRVNPHLPGSLFAPASAAGR